MWLPVTNQAYPLDIHHVNHTFLTYGSLSSFGPYFVSSLISLVAVCTCDVLPFFFSKTSSFLWSTWSKTYVAASEIRQFLSWLMTWLNPTSQEWFHSQIKCRLILSPWWYSIFYHFNWLRCLWTWKLLLWTCFIFPLTGQSHWSFDSCSTIYQKLNMCYFNDFVRLSIIGKRV